jgi:hypothetical protein
MALRRPVVGQRVVTVGMRGVFFHEMRRGLAVGMGRCMASPGCSRSAAAGGPRARHLDDREPATGSRLEIHRTSTRSARRSASFF